MTPEQCKAFEANLSQIKEELGELEGKLATARARLAGARARINNLEELLMELASQ